MIVLGVEGTAHTFGIGVIDTSKDGAEKIIADVRDSYVPEKGGIHPAEAATHHRNVANGVLQRALDEAKIKLGDVDVIAFSAGPGLPPCLRATLEFAKEISTKAGKPLLPVNHPIAHIEIGRALTWARDPIVLYVSGGNTQVIGYAAGRYRVFGETLDIAIGNAIDTFMREAGGGFPGGPAMAKLAENGKQYIELPYVVKGMDLSFSGIVTAALKILKEEKASLEDLCFSFQETCFAMLTEVTERAMAHTGKEEVLLTGGVGASKRLQEMLRIMCEERNAKLFSCPMKWTGDNGSMIAVAAELMINSGMKPVSLNEADFRSRWRADEVEIKWMD